MSWDVLTALLCEMSMQVSAGFIATLMTRACPSPQNYPRSSQNIENIEVFSAEQTVKNVVTKNVVSAF